MPDEQQMQMHPDFPRWYREVDLNEQREESRERVHNRWAGLSSLVANLDRETVKTLLRIVFRDKTNVSEDAVARIRQAFKIADDLFAMQGNDREMEVLSGALLAVLLDRNGDLAAWTGLAITTAGMEGLRPLHVPMDLVGYAENAIARISEKNRERPSLDGMKIASSKIDVAKVKEKLLLPDVASIGNAFDTAAASINSMVAGLAKQFTAFAESAAHFMAVQDEELNMLWWVLGERSDGAKQAFTEVPEFARPVAYGNDLAIYTLYLPGPRSAAGLLARAGLTATESMTIPDVVNSCSIPLMKQLLNGHEPSSLIQPLHFAIERKLETGDEQSWIAGWSAKCGLSPTVRVPSLTLGMIFYRERLLARF